MKKIIIALIVGILLVSVISAGYSIINSENNTHTNTTLKNNTPLDMNLSADSNDTINLDNNKLIKNLIQSTANSYNQMQINKPAIFDGNNAQNINNESNQQVEKNPKSNISSNSEPGYCYIPEDYGKHEFDPTQPTLPFGKGTVVDEEFYMNLILSFRYNSTYLPNDVKELLLEHPELDKDNYFNLRNDTPSRLPDEAKQIILEHPQLNEDNHFTPYLNDTC